MKVMEEIITKENLLYEAEVLKTKKFRPGFDNMTADASSLWLQINGDQMVKKILQGEFEPMPAVSFASAKRSGGNRLLSKQTALDTIVQNCLLSWLARFCDNFFSDNSFAYRENRGLSAALMAYCDMAGKYRYAATYDPIACFDMIDHTTLQKVLEEYISDHRFTDLLQKYIQQPILLDNEIVVRDKGLLQGSPLSPVLCNLYFHPMDRYLEENHIVFLRYGDDIVLFATEMSTIQTHLNIVRKYASEKLLLNENTRKHKLASPDQLVYLGHKFLRDRNGVIALQSSVATATAFHAWHTEQIVNNRRRVDIVSDGILRQKEYSLLFESEDGSSHIPVNTTDIINIYSNVIFDSGFLERALSQGTMINLFNRENRLVGHFVPESPLKSASVTLEQLQSYGDTKERTALAKAFLLGSIHNTRLNIRYYNKYNRIEPYADALSGIETLVRKIKKCKDYESLLLMEAQVRNLYYGCFDHFLEEAGFHYEKRSRRPPENEINAMLSFGNVVLYNLIAVEINKSALDIRIGFLHATNQRKESLNLDVAELFKPLIVDRVVFTLANRNRIGREHFSYHEDGGVYLSPEGVRKFLRAFYEKLDTVVTVKDKKMNYNQIIKEEVNKLVRHFRNGSSYVPFKQVR